MDIDGRTALVTGANRGIGRAIAAELDRRGALVLSGVRERDPGHQAPGTEVEIDLSSQGAIEEGLAALGARLGEVDILVNNAGVFEGGLFDEIEPDQLYELIQVNLAGPLHLTRAILPSMLKRGSGLIVNNASIVGRAPFPGAAAYAATKGGVVAFTESLRRELEQTDVRVLELITPGVDTDMMSEVQTQLGEHVDTSGWDRVDPEDWAGKVADAIEAGDETLHPSTVERLAELIPAGMLSLVSKRSFDR
jgi:short-subunit dehydrogenase